MTRFLIGLIAGLISGILLFGSLLERNDDDLMED
tara:strand:- start:183 stop:284 length:102 start_codon:yes stop_codon:yes gene_type:complete